MRRFLSDREQIFEMLVIVVLKVVRVWIPAFFEALGKLRAVFGQQLAELAALDELDLSKNIKTILPPPIDQGGNDDFERKYWAVLSG